MPLHYFAFLCYKIFIIDVKSNAEDFKASYYNFQKKFVSTTNFSKEIAPTLLFVTMSCSRVHELRSNRNRKQICWVLDENTLNKLIVVTSDI